MKTTPHTNRSISSRRSLKSFWSTHNSEVCHLLAVFLIRCRRTLYSPLLKNRTSTEGDLDLFCIHFPIAVAALQDIFSDDESDNLSSSEDDVRSSDCSFEDAGNHGDNADNDSGLEYVIASPGRPPVGRPRAEKRVEAPKAEDGGFLAA